MRIRLLPSQLGLYLNALSRGSFEKVELAFAGRNPKWGLRRLREELELMFQGHPSLCQGITWHAREPWIVRRDCFRLEVLDGRSLREPSLRDRIGSKLRNLERQVSASDASGGLLVAAGDSVFELYLLIDHMYFDGESIAVIEDDLRSIWLGLAPRAPASWTTFAEAVHDELARTQELSSCGDLNGLRPWLPGVSRHAGDPATASIPVRLPQPALKQAMEDYGATEFQIILTAYGLALAAAFHCRDFVVSVATAGLRMHDERLLSETGCFTNTVYIRVDVNGVSSFDGLLDITRHKLIDAMESDVPAVLAIDSEFAIAAKAGAWLIRRLIYPSISVLEPLPVTGPELAVTGFRRIEFPYQVNTTAPRLMSVLVSRKSDTEFHIDAWTDSHDEGIPNHVAGLMADILLAVAEHRPGVLAGLLSQVNGYQPAMWGGPDDERGVSPSGGDASAWLREVLEADWATGVVPDLLIRSQAGGPALAAATGVMPVIKAYALAPDTVSGLPMELVRRDASPEGIALSRAMYGREDLAPEIFDAGDESIFSTGSSGGAPEDACTLRR